MLNNVIKYFCFQHDYAILFLMCTRMHGYGAQLLSTAALWLVPVVCAVLKIENVDRTIPREMNMFILGVKCSRRKNVDRHRGCIRRNDIVFQWLAWRPVKPRSHYDALHPACRMQCVVVWTAPLNNMAGVIADAYAVLIRSTSRMHTA